MSEKLSDSVTLARSTAVAQQQLGEAPLRTSWASPLLALLAAAIFVSPWDSASLVYVNAASMSDLWRFVTSHWVHWSAEHLVWSGGAFLVLGIVCERRGRRRFLVTTLASAIAIPIALRIFQPGLLSYGGLSGIDSALFGLICAQDLGPTSLGLGEAPLRQAPGGPTWGRCGATPGRSGTSHRCFASRGLRRRSWKSIALPAALLAGFLAKIGYEFFAGAALFVSHTDTMVPVPLAHLVGAAVGILASLDLHRTVFCKKDAARVRSSV